MTAYTLPTLTYDYAALEPAISGRIMELHHLRCIPVTLRKITYEKGSDQCSRYRNANS